MSAATKTLPDGRARDLDELWLYEGLRIGSVRAMRDLLTAHHAPMLTLARLYQPEDPERLVAHTWDIALGGLGTFVWHTSFRSWLFGLLVSRGRADDGSGVAPEETPAAGHRLLQRPDAVATSQQPTTGQLPWSGWWTPDSWAAIQRWLAARSRAEREVVVLIDQLGWTPADARDALSWTDASMGRMHARVHADLRAALSAEMGVPLAGDLAPLLAQLPAPIDPDPPPALIDAYRRWRRERGLTGPRRVAGWLRRGRRHRIAVRTLSAV